MMKKWFKIGFVLIVCAAVAACGVKDEEKDANSEGAAEQSSRHWTKPPAMEIDQSKSYEAVFKTSKGDFAIELFDDTAPITVNNFVFLSRQGFYDGVTFHRIIETFMIQTGDPEGTGMGGPGYTIQDELGGPYTYEKGIVAMAKTREPNSGGSQFFICTGPDCEGLNQYPNYAIFGRVSSGMETVEAIAATPVAMGGEDVPSKPTETVTIKTIEIKEK